MTTTKKKATLGDMPGIWYYTPACCNRNTVCCGVYLQVTMTYVAYLCCRLLDIRHETRAARIIQAWWRKSRVQHHAGQHKVYTPVACGADKIALSTVHTVNEE